MSLVVECIVRLAGPEGRTRPTQFLADTTVAEAAEQLREPFAVPHAVPNAMIDMVFKGVILDKGAAIGNCGIGPGDTVFLVDPSQPASNKRGAKDAGGQPNRMSFDMDGPADRGLQEHGKAQREENPLLQLIRELENQVKHLRRSNQELQDAGPDADFEEAVNENCVAIGKKEALIHDLKKQLDQIQGVNLYGVTDQMQTEESGGIFL